MVRLRRKGRHGPRRLVHRRLPSKASTPTSCPPPATSSSSLNQPANLDAKGTPNPDATGTYAEYGQYEGFILYKHITKAYWLWHDLNTRTWVISLAPGNMGPGAWLHSPELLATYNPNPPSTGTITITAQ